jgi:hypothetical protein
MGKLKTQWMILILVGLFSLGIIFSYHIRNQRLMTNWLYLRKSITTMANVVKEKIPPDSNVLIIWQSPYTFPITMIQYVLTPRKFSIIKMSEQKLKKKWQRSLSAYQYVLLAYTDKVFWKRYAQAFPKQPPLLKPYVQYVSCGGMHEDFLTHDACRRRTTNVYLFRVVHHRYMVALQEVMQ